MLFEGSGGGRAAIAATAFVGLKFLSVLRVDVHLRAVPHAVGKKLPVKNHAVFLRGGGHLLLITFTKPSALVFIFCFSSFFCSL